MPETVMVSYSELDAYRQCPLKWALNYRDRWTRHRDGGDALSRGSLWHAVMEAHYQVIQRMRRKPDGSWLRHPSQAKTAEILWACKDAVLAILVQEGTGEVTEDAELIGWMYDGYIQQYGIDEDWEILGVEHAGSAWLRTERGGRSRFVLRFKIDLVIRDLVTNQIKIVDHKSASNFSRPAEIDIDDQFALYWWGVSQHGLNPSCVIRSDARTQRNKSPMLLEDRFRRVQTHRNAHELTNVALDAYRTAKQAYGRTELIHSSPAPDRCVWRCDYLEPHLAMRKGVAAPAVILKDFGFYQREDKHPEYASTEEGLS